MKIPPVMAVTILIFVSSCAASQDQPQTGTVNNMEEPSEKDYYYVMPEEKRRIFLTNIVKINLGVSPEEVKEILGEPTYDQVMMRKERDEVVGRVLKYYFRRYKDGLVNEKYDRIVRLWFSKENKLTEVTTDVEEILELKLSIVKPLLRFTPTQSSPKL